MIQVSEPSFKISERGRKYKTAQYSCGYCGTISEKRVGDVSSGRTTSCGCFRRANASKLSKTHGSTSSKEYKAWSNMISRCYNAKVINYKDYGGRGIRVCDRWSISRGGSFENFLQDMGSYPEGMTLDRKDVDGDYEPSNCRWVSLNVQAFNKRVVERELPLGVYSSKDSVRIYLGVEGKSLYLGSTGDLQKAIDLRKDAEVKYYGEFL